jgi:hypothetical protein
MKKELIDFLGNLGITWKYLANGVIGGAAWSFHTKSDIFDSIRQIFIGGMVAGFTTPLIAERGGYVENRNTPLHLLKWCDRTDSIKRKPDC